MKLSQIKPLKHNVHRFASWLKQYAAGYQEYHDEAREIRELKTAKSAAATPQKTKSKSQSSGAAVWSVVGAVAVTKQVRFKMVQLETDCHQLIDKLVMEVLGFSHDGMLVEALRK
ncbi:hypothetical protein H310_11767 [Aphanomyces invadans]|uniref:Uncharacterized protein n=1 Tax=Aphanomyces invadans TaxID=157072 RepID=A0A024TKD6_9STRA|nr:hypothetical protein H310_11767 [Aphanomyces invadans]ETV94439.1 hypothetical protein H310_11767 [Aphanomyces invadans]|eukprot:XP_008876754.1 hypothetical protein H310_11767 [Aphanomyces invadans]